MAILKNHRRQLGTGLIALVLIAASLTACTQEPSVNLFESLPEPAVRAVEPPRSILFIGNSFTYFNEGIDHHLREIYRSAHDGTVLTIERQTTPNQTLRGHYEDPATKEALRRRDWDIVVIQAASYEAAGADTMAEFHEYAARLAQLTRNTGAEPAFFMTWAFWSEPAMIEQIAQAYVEAGNANRALVVPAGLAWEQFRRERAAISLYSDNRHPSTAGTYLAACVFLASLFNESPVGIRYSAGLPRQEAAFLQKVAWDAVQRSNRRGEQGPLKPLAHRSRVPTLLMEPSAVVGEIATGK